MSSFRILYIQCRSLHTTSSNLGKRNFRKFMLQGKRGSTEFKKRLPNISDRDLKELTNRGVRPVNLEGENILIPEMIPELIVPDLEGFELKPYVSYRVPDVVQAEFTPQDLFMAVYSKKIAEDFKNGKLDEDGNSTEPSMQELLTVEEAKNKANSIGADKFADKTWVEN